MNHIGNGWKEVEKRFRQQSDSKDKKQINKWKNRILDNNRIIDSIDSRNFKDKKIYHARFALRGSLINTFEYSSEFSKSTSWTLEGIMALRSYDGGPADILICNSKNHGTIAILALVQKEDSNPVLQRCKKISNHLESNKSAIENDLSIHIADVEIAVAVSEVSPVDVVNSWETSGIDPGNDKISVWQFKTEESERLSVVEQFANVNWDAHIPPGRLGDELQSGIEIAERPHLSLEFFLDSHPKTIIRNFAKIQFQKHNKTDTKNSYFSKSELIEELKLGAEARVTKQEVSDRANELIDWWEYIGIIGEAPNPKTYDDNKEVYSIKVGLMHLSTGMRELHEKYKDCMREAIVELDIKESVVD